MKCKYYTDHMDTLLEYYKCLYKIKDCGAGGILHILLDDDNYDDESIMYCLKECLTNPKKEESALGLLICKEYLKMNMEERSVFDWLHNGWNGECSDNHDCSKCRYCSWENLEENIGFAIKEEDKILAIRDILINSDAVTCTVESYEPDLYMGNTLYRVPSGHRVTIDYNKLAKAIYKAGYRKAKGE